MRVSTISKVSRARPLLGTVVEITAQSRDRSLSFEAISHAFEAIKVIHQKLSFHDPKSLLSEINFHAACRPVAIDSQTVRLLRIARDLYTLTSGIFDVTVAQQLVRDGFLPSHNRIGFSSQGSFADVEVMSEGFVRFHRAGIRIDLGGIAKGLAVAEAVALLCEMGVESGCVNAGGDLQVFGNKCVPVQIRDPRCPQIPFTTISIRNRAVATSAHYFTNRIKKSAKTGPFVDPRTGEFSSSALSVTVVAPDPVYADALTKVVMVDPFNSIPLLTRFNAAALKVDFDGSIQCTPNWHASIQTT